MFYLPHEDISQTAHDEAEGQMEPPMIFDLQPSDCGPIRKRWTGTFPERDLAQILVNWRLPNGDGHN
jgi:hypothetical protein